VSAVILLFLAIKARRIWRFLRLRRVAAHPENSPQVAAAVWYGRMTRALARRGWRKSSTQTAGEFVVSIDDADLQQVVARFTNHYRGARFGDSAEDAKQLPELYEKVTATGRR
jgi:hypothetical protein